MVAKRAFLPLKGRNQEAAIAKCFGDPSNDVLGAGRHVLPSEPQDYPPQALKEIVAIDVCEPPLFAVMLVTVCFDRDQEIWICKVGMQRATIRQFDPVRRDGIG